MPYIVYHTFSSANNKLAYGLSGLLAREKVFRVQIITYPTWLLWDLNPDTCTLRRIRNSSLSLFLLGHKAYHAPQMLEESWVVFIHENQHMLLLKKNRFYWSISIVRLAENQEVQFLLTSNPEKWVIKDPLLSTQTHTHAHTHTCGTTTLVDPLTMWVIANNTVECI